MKKKIIYILLFIVILVGAIFAYYITNNEKEKFSFSLNEQRWIENNKNNVIDFYIPSDIDIFSYVGKGVYFDFLDAFSTTTGLTINKTSYKANTKVDKPYAFKTVDKVGKNDILVHEDNYVLLSKNEEIFKNLESVENYNIALIESDLDKANLVFDGLNVNFITFENIDELMNDYLSEESVNNIDAVLILKTSCLNYMLQDNLHINYQIDEMTKYFVLSLNGDQTLNSIFKKYYQRWSKDNYEISYNNHLLSQYFDQNNITEIEKNALQEKKYIYGFVDFGAYDLVKHKKLYGINYQLIKSFAVFANIDMDFLDSYLSYDSLIQDFEKNKIDLVFKNNNYKVSERHFKTIDCINAKIVILTNVKNKKNYNNLNSLNGETIAVLKNSLIEKELKKLNIKVKSYNTIDKLLNDLKDDEIIAIELDNYEYYKSDKLVNFKIAYEFNDIFTYGYMVNSNDKVFYDLFNFYLEYMSVDDIIVLGYDDIYHVKEKTNILYILVLVMSLLLCLEFIGHLRKILYYLKNRTKHKLSKNDKLKYIDQLTSLKNRLYLNDTMEKWDNSDVYPQSIIVIELNDLSDINNNFGHEEGDKVILEAANILIRTQLPNTEIIRTNGSEFLIYMIGYDEKQTVAYLRKLNKELEDLSHGYGAVTGYSIITDGIKTIDDAINEATLDVRTNKELLDQEQ